MPNIAKLNLRDLKLLHKRWRTLKYLFVIRHENLFASKILNWGKLIQ